jgi:hypothetical protein
VQDPHAFVPFLALREEETGRTIQQGVWNEELVDGREGDRLLYRHGLQQDGTYVIEEQYVGGEYTYVRGIQRAIERRSTRFWLEPTGILRAGEIMIESLVGEERYRIERKEHREYIVSRQEVDGSEASFSLSTPILFSTTQLAMTAIPLLLKIQAKQMAEMTLPTFGLERDGIHLHPLKIAPFSGETSLLIQGEKRWQVTIDRPVAPVTLIYSLSSDGTCVQVESPGSSWTPGEKEQ